MSEPPVEPELFPWLPAARVLSWIGLTAEDDRAPDAEAARLAAAEWCEDQRRDLSTVVDDVTTFNADHRIVFAGCLAASRLFDLKGKASFAELGPGSVLDADTEVRQLLGIGVYARPALG